MVFKAVLCIIFCSVYVYAEFIRDDNKSVVIDTARNLMWQDQKEVRVDREGKRVEGGNAWNFYNAQGYCRDLDYGGFNDWYLPSSDQLLTVVQTYKGKDYSMKLQPRAFKHSGDWTVFYWSSSIAPYRNTYGLSCEREWCSLSKMESVLSVRCVREISK